MSEELQSRERFIVGKELSVQKVVSLHLLWNWIVRYATLGTLHYTGLARLC